MKEIFEQRLFEKYPTLYKYAQDDFEEEEMMPQIGVYGFQCEDGWFQLIDAVSHVIETSVNEKEDRENVHAHQIKEKFGGLRVYLDKQPDDVRGVVRLAQVLSKNMCEKCGTTKGVSTSGSGRIQSLCESCLLDSRDVGREIEIWELTMECFKCGADTDVVYPRGVGGKHGGTWACVGEQLSEKMYCKVEETYSDVQDEFVWGNMCTSCGAYQGNYYVWEAAYEYVSANGWTEVPMEFRQLDTITRR